MAASDRLKDKAHSLGADFFGIADLTLAKDAFESQSGLSVREFPRAISIGIALLDTIVDLIADKEDQAAAKNYMHHCYNVINQRLDQIASRLSSELQKEQYTAFPVPASQTINPDKWHGLISNKLAAHLSGLGWIGKSCLLVTPQNGPRVRWATVLTNAPFEPTGEPTDEKCGNCTLCVDICPTGAFSGRAFNKNEERELRFDVFKCNAYFDDLIKQGKESKCGLCIYVCPHGRRSRKS